MVVLMQTGCSQQPSKPVSYTHLDVYKRQPFIKACKQRTTKVPPTQVPNNEKTISDCKRLARVNDVTYWHTGIFRSRVMI